MVLHTTQHRMLLQKYYMILMKTLRGIMKLLIQLIHFPSTNKFSGDYIADKRNYISVRDGKNALTYAFFIHFEKNNGNMCRRIKRHDEFNQ